MKFLRNKTSNGLGKWLGTPVFLLLFVCMLFFQGVPMAAYAQTAPTSSGPGTTLPTIDASVLTPANGWQSVSCSSTFWQGVQNFFSGFSGVSNTCYSNSQNNTTAECTILISGQGTQTNQCRLNNANGTTSVSTTGVNGSTVVNTSVNANNQVTAEQVITAPAASAECTNITNSWHIECAIVPTAQFLFDVAGFLLGLVGMIFNWIMVLTVFQFAAYFGNSQGMLIAWGVLRDVGNIVLLFGFIFMGVMVILDTDHGGSKKAIPTLIIFAVLLNFSLFAAEAVVDVSNVLSAALFNQAGQCTSVQACGLTPTTSTGSLAAAAGNTGISGTIITTLGINTMLNPSNTTIISMAKNGTQGALFFLGASIFMIITMFVLLAASIMFFIRAVVLAFVLVTSPIGFAGMAVAPLKGVANLWWKTLLTESFFAPVLLLLILVSLKIMSGIGLQTAQGGTYSFADAIANPNSSDIGIFLIFILLISFLIASITVSKSMGAMGADYATKAAKKAVGVTVGAPIIAGMAGAGFVGRRTVGRYSGHLASKIRDSDFGRTEMGRFFAGVADKGASASFDARGLSGVKGLGKAAGIDIKGPNKDAAHGYHGIEKKAVDERLAYAKSLGDRKVTETKDSKTYVDRQKDAANAIKTATSAQTAAKADKTDKQVAHDGARSNTREAIAETLKQETLLAQINAESAQDPKNARLKAQALQQSQKVAAARNAQADAETVSGKTARDLADSDKKLIAANDSLTKARTDEEAAEKFQTISAQKAYADNLEKANKSDFKWTAPYLTVANHANATAIAKIRGNENKSQLRKVFEGLAEERETEKGGGDKKPDAKADGDAHGGGGGDHH